MDSLPDEQSIFDRTAILSVMQHRMGRRFVSMILAQTGYMQSPFSQDSISMAFNVGQQNIGRWLYGVLDNECPDLLYQLLKESKEDYQNDRDPNTDE